MATVADIQQDIADARTAIGAGNWSTAETKLMQAWAALFERPDSQHDEQQLSWNRRDIERLLDHVRNKKSEKVGIQRTKVKYTRAT